MAEAVQELKITVTLVHQDREVRSLEKIFGMQSSEDENAESKGIDGATSAFLNEIQQTANSEGYTVTEEEMNKLAVLLILAIVKQESAILEVQVEKEEAKVETGT